LNKEKLKLIRKNSPIHFKKHIDVGSENIIIFNPNFPVYWEVLESN
jgi:hypothetical protein